MISVRANDLPSLHPRLLWSELVVCLAAVIRESGYAKLTLPIQIVRETGASQEIVDLEPNVLEIPEPAVERVRRTYDRSRIVEMAGIAVAGVAAYHILDLEIVDVAARGTGADYVCLPGPVLLEVAARSHKHDAASAWSERIERLKRRSSDGC